MKLLDEMTMQTMLNELWVLYENPDLHASEVYLSKMHPLAEAKYEPAKAFFVAGLDDKRWDWRYDCLTALGFHYDLSNDDHIKEKLRYLLLHDEDDSVRSVAATSLGRCTVWPEKALFTALQTDNDPDVRESAFLSLLLHGGMPFSMYIKTVNKIQNGEIEPTLTSLKDMLHSLNLNPEFPPEI
jgi:hypothetical protein